MISSPEEARLLLNKWRSESVRLVAFVSTFPSPPTDFVFRLEGLITTVVEEEGRVVVVFESGDNFIMFRISETVEYKEAVQMSADLNQLFAKERQGWQAALCLSYQHSSLIFCERI